MTGNKIDSINPTDEVLPPRSLVRFGLQHVLVMAASPITAVFLVSKALGFSDALTVSLISATFLICGLGSILQSFGPAGFGARLPFIMVPGGAPIAIFLAIQQTDVQTAVGAVILTAVFYFLALPVFRRLLRYFPPIVVGTMLLLVSVNLVRIYGGTITGKQGSEGFADPMNVGLALATIALTVIFARVFTGTLQRISVMLGLIAGSAIAIGAGYMDLSGIFDGPVIAVPQLLPFGMPKFDFFAALPLIVFSIISMAEATGQTIATAEIVGRRGDAHAIVPATIRGDAVASLVGGLFGTSLIITSGENVGIVRATNVKSRYVTATAGVILVLIALFAPIGRLANALPGPVVGGTAVIVFSIIGVIGIDLLRRVDLREHGPMFTLAAALSMGLLPILVPGVYSQFPQWSQMILANGLAAGTITAVIVNAIFQHLPLEQFQEKCAAVFRPE
ncbi:uracil-xanthine permease [Sinorhizobium meliloti]|uniref:uracil-xanthine permease family protein n=1 Tax=Rhizobium meliloti TaxID=382 RepID=UPI000FD7F850|nr:uracil-xanthine permease family protein [Sinorhizobium meliloti]MDE3787558.1 uracil-xanthine permease [Sinorhizobium meliloti]RVG71600.1 uracil-xanthine permease [Sinorhizobium meliloti]RVM37707.1 uracil-xanthine permease [Sinorhizobium meliloti]UIJ92563.1 uracil-xanthine permease family protein [Sinorhizobium meliloti]WKL29198.1 uracil-xanthine permease family protein [Sinorhizobium meliloti]